MRSRLDRDGFAQPVVDRLPIELDRRSRRSAESYLPELREQLRDEAASLLALRLGDLRIRTGGRELTKMAQRLDAVAASKLRAAEIVEYRRALEESPRLRELQARGLVVAGVGEIETLAKPLARLRQRRLARLRIGSSE